MKNLTKTSKIIFILIINFVVIWLLNFLSNKSIETLSKYGSKGDEVVKIQTVLKNSGYYNGNIDGIFGIGTKKGVIEFQKANGLNTDGIAGKDTLKLMKISSDLESNGTMTSSDINLLAKVISAEARGEPYTGQIAVGAVILNRIEHPSFPNTLAGVVYQPGAFSCMDDGQIDQPIEESATRAAQDAINGFDPSSGAIYYYNPTKTSNKFMLSRPVIVAIGAHKFCS